MENVTKKSGTIASPTSRGYWAKAKDGGNTYVEYVIGNIPYHYKYEYNYKGDIFVFGSKVKSGSIDSMVEKSTGLHVILSIELDAKPGGQEKLVEAFITAFHKKHAVTGNTPIGTLLERGRLKNGLFFQPHLTLIM